MNLQRITTQFIEGEDRIRLTGQLDDGQTVVLWLTQRLLQRLVPHLCQWLEKQTPTKPQESPLRAQVQQSFAQQKARAEIERQAPVQADAVSLAWLVSAVDLKPTPQGPCLVFRGRQENERAVLGLPSRFLRQWLGILHDQFRAAAWPAEVWPEWMEQAAQPVRDAGPMKVLH